MGAPGNSRTLAAGAALFCFFVQSFVGAQDPGPVDYRTQIEPLFHASCEGAFCHVHLETSGVELTSYETVMASKGRQYERLIVVPSSAAESPLLDKIASGQPAFGERMPLDAKPLGAEEIALISRWIDEGAQEFATLLLRGDVDLSGTLNLTDAIRILRYLFAGGVTIPCEPIADATADGVLNLTDGVRVLNFLFRSGEPLPPLSNEEIALCRNSNRPPTAAPIGTVEAREGVEIEFEIVASDADGDDLVYRARTAPDGLEVDAATGVVRWTPRFGNAGDHRISIDVTDTGSPPLSATTTGLIRVLEGNHPPAVEPTGTVYGREGVLLTFALAARDPDDDKLAYALVEAPAGSRLDAGSGTFEWTPAAGQAGEHPLTCRITDDGFPPQSVDVSGLLVVVPADSPVNQPPAVPPHDVYRTYTGFEVRLPIGASDPDGHSLTHEAESLPAGASLDAASGILSWTPAPEQAGAHYVPFTVTDDGVPPESFSGVLTFRVSPPDPCSIADCDPATGCTAELVPIAESCCGGEPTVRVPEPVAGCPGGRVLHVGRNNRGFGRLENCDRLQIAPFAQGGSNVRFHIEARCINITDVVNVQVRLETATEMLLERNRDVGMVARGDGFAQRLTLIFGLAPGVDLGGLEGREAQLTVIATDVDGIVLEKRLRLVLTLNDLPDLPEPDVDDVPAGEVGCVGCHRPLDATGQRVGIEDPHPWYPLTCTDCHGGNAETTVRALAHVPPPIGAPAYLRNLSSDQLDQVPPDYLRFVNPGDMRVADRGCGSKNPANPGSGCHQSIVETLPLSVMSTYAGHYTLPRFLAGSQDRSPLYAAVDVVDPDYDAATAPPGAVASLAALREPAPDAVRSAIGTCIDVYLPKSCPTCHLNDFGPNNAAGNYRSSGCTACHMRYADDGVSRSADPVIARVFPPHPVTHQLTSAIPAEQCSHCHFQGGRIGLAFRGIREGGFPPEKTPPNGVTLGRDLHAHDANYYFSDEDDTNDVDETPPDLHFAAGLVCADCHVGGDVHGDGHLYGAERDQLGIRCEDCHGTVRAEIGEDPADGIFKNSKGFALRRIRRTEDDRILLKLSMEDRELEIPQIHRILESGVNLAMTEAMGVDEDGFSHTDKLECYACHTSWRQTCFGCHITVDDSGSGTNRTTGDESQGAISVVRDDYSLDFYALGINKRGKLSPLCSSMSIYMTYVDENGVEQYRDRVRTSHDGRTGFGWNPFHHHTVSRVPQNCDRCHPVAAGAGPDNSETLRETYGFGNGRFLSTDGEGTTRDLSAFLNDAGELISDFPHPGTGPVPAPTRERATSIEVVPHPRLGE